MADGVNWGLRSKRASRCAVRAALNYLNSYLFLNTNQQHVKTTHDLFKIMSKAFDEAQEFIVKRNGTMTTLCCSVIVKLASDPSLHVVCTLSVGDSTAYVYSREKGVFELTKGSRDLSNDRDMRDVGGALGMFDFLTIFFCWFDLFKDVLEFFYQEMCMATNQICQI